VIFGRLKRPIPYGEILLIRGASYLLTALNPGVGQGGMAYWISKRKSIPFKQVVSVMLMLPVVDMAFLAVILTVSLGIHYLSGGILPPLQAGLLGWAVVIMWILLVAHFAFWNTGFFAGRLGKFRESDFLMGYRTAAVKDYMVLLGIRFAMNISGVFAYFFGLILFNIKVPFWIFTVRFFPAIIIQALPITVGQFGTSQGAWILMYQDYADHSLLAAFSLVWITVYNISRLIIGAFCFRKEAGYYFSMKDGKTGAADNTEESDDGR